MISIETLRRFPLFGGLGPDTLKAIAMSGDEAVYEAGAWLVHEGEPADRLFLVLDGEVALTIKMSANGTGPQPIRLHTRTSGEIIGWSALVPPHVYTLGAVARSAARLAAFDGERLRAALDADPVAGYQFMSRVTEVVGERLVGLRTQFVSVTAP